MPSSHGGSSSGGGGFHSSGGGGGGYRGGGRPSGPRFSTRSSFPGARRYYYTNRFGRTCFFYYAARPTRQNTLSAIMMPVIFILAGLAIAAFIIYNTIPHKLYAGQCITTGEYVRDNAGLLGDTTALEKTLADFYEKTGIEPCILTIKYEDFNVSVYGKMSVAHLGNYGYDQYVRTYDDEGHWMIIYAQSEDGLYTWTDMAGDDTYDITDNMITVFADVFDKALVRGNDVTSSLNDAFKTVNSKAMNLSKTDVATIAFVVIFLLIWTAASASTIISTIKKNKVINEYCDFRDKRGGKDFYESATVTGSENVSYTSFTGDNSNNSSSNSSNDADDFFD